MPIVVIKLAQPVADWNIEEMTGYHPMYTFYSDLSVGEQAGLEGVKTTYDMVMEGWSQDYKAFTEFVMALNWKSWAHATKGVAVTPMAKLYVDLFYKAKKYAETHLKGEELAYFYSTID